ncbi:MAG: type II toxin-antitoxin system RelE/ParE family toxin [Synergistaceae bacterium]|nr:type II toxin-antitoxin system RelE/ParE family toxin [Synergistaceae bacterium]
MVYRIKIYKDAHGNQPIKEYLSGLAGKTDKDSRIKLCKIDYYLQALREYGTRVGEPFVKHIDGDIWELRPLHDRFFFFCWQGDSFILLHHFVKKTQKTPKKEIEQAERNLNNFIERSTCNEK